MNNIEIARAILKELEMPKSQQADLCCYVLLAMAEVGQGKSFSKSRNDWIRIHDILIFIKENYHIEYAENSRETFRKQAIHHFRNAALIEDNGKATNSPNYRYRLTNEFLSLLKSHGKKEWQIYLNEFRKEHQSLINIYVSKKQMKKMPVQIDGNLFTFSPGKHNELQKYILEEFAPRFAQNCQCLYVGDTIQKDMIKNIQKLKELGLTITMHDKMPDVVLYRQDKDWIYFIESVTSVGSMDSKRVFELQEITKNIKSGKIFVTAFLDFATYKKFSSNLAWETEVWIASAPEHMIHLNGDKFLGPRG